jgi:uncharacterized protein with GYD domain
MGMYLAHFAYTPEAIKGLIESPEDRTQTVGKTCESLGGKLHGLWYTFGDYDGYVLSELPDDAAAAAFAMTVLASGAIAKLETTPLMTASQAVDAFKRAGDATYVAPGHVHV